MSELPRLVEFGLRVSNTGQNIRFAELPQQGAFSVSMKAPAPEVVVKEEFYPPTAYGFYFFFNMWEKDLVALKTFQVMGDPHIKTEEDYIKSLINPILEIVMADPIRYELNQEFYFRNNPYTHDRLSENIDYFKLAKEFANMYCRFASTVRKETIKVDLYSMMENHQRYPFDRKWVGSDA